VLWLFLGNIVGFDIQDCVDQILAKVDPKPAAS
jgi:hypothetical protein